MQASPKSTAGETVVAEPKWARIAIWVAFPLLGALAGWLLEFSAGWVADLEWVPFQGPFKLIDSISDPEAMIGALAVGGVAGFVLAFLAAEDRLTVTVSNTQVELARGDTSQVIDGRQVRSVFLDGKQLVLLGRSGEELARESSDLGSDQLRDAFRGHGYVWLVGGDPYKDEYRRWVDGTPDVSASANALFKARQHALDKGEGDDVAEFRRELARLGIVVRDEQKRQYWRRIERAPEGSDSAS